MPVQGCRTGPVRPLYKLLLRIAGILLLYGLTGCGSSSHTPYTPAQPVVTVYVVQRGDTLYSIAFRYGLDYRKVAQVNNIFDPFTIYPGQNIYLWQVQPPLAGAAPGPDPAGYAAPVAPGYTAPPAAPSAPVVVTAVPAVTTAPVSKVVKPTPVYGARPPVSSGVYHPGARPVQAPEIKTPPIAPTATPAGSVTVLTAAPGAAPEPAQAPVPAQPRVEPQGSADAVARAPTTAPAPAPGPAPAPATAPPPARAPTPGANVTTWRWPAAGSVTRGYSSSVHKGIDIGGDRGDPIYAVADGTVVYAGTGIVGFGELVIVKHNDIYISAYGHNERLLVKENDVVGAGQVIAEKGSSGTDSVKLHFEIRKEGKPVDPLKLLPRR